MFWPLKFNIAGYDPCDVTLVEKSQYLRSDSTLHKEWTSFLKLPSLREVSIPGKLVLSMFNDSPLDRDSIFLLRLYVRLEWEPYLILR